MCSKSTNLSFPEILLQSIAKEVLEIDVMIFAVHDRRYWVCSSVELFHQAQPTDAEVVDFKMACSIQAGVSTDFSHA